MAKRPKKGLVDSETVVSDKFRTTPIAEAIRKVSGLPQSAILSKCADSSLWQFRVFLEGKQRKPSTKEEELVSGSRSAIGGVELLKAPQVRRYLHSQRMQKSKGDATWFF